MFILQTSRYYIPAQNFEPDPILRSRRSRNTQTKLKTAFFKERKTSWIWGPSRMLKFYHSHGHGQIYIQALIYYASPREGEGKVV